MGTRGRKSSLELVGTPGAVALIERPKPPLELTAEQSEVWVFVANAMPADWFTPENFPLLGQYCRHVVRARQLAQLIEQQCSSLEMDTREFTDLLGAETKQTAIIKSVATAMRLTQKARYDAQKSSTAKKRGGTGKRPWDD